MKAVILFALVFGVAVAAPQKPHEATILRFENEYESPANFRYAFETSDGQTREESGQLVNPGTDEESLNVRGSYSFVQDDGKTYSVNYIADQNGFQPIINH